MTTSEISKTTVSPAIPAPRARIATGGLRRALDDGLVVAWRNLKRVPRIPELAIFAIIQSIVFVVLFAFVFGGAIPLPNGGDYTEFLLPGIFAQTIIFACVTTAVGVTDDNNKGILDRFRSLPMARSAVLSGRVIFDQVYQFGILIVLMLTGLVVGWRVHSNVPEFVAGVALLMLFAFAMSWVGVWMGFSVRTVESANQVGFTFIFPITFISNVFVPPESLPGWLEPVAEWNPVSALTASLRQLWGNPNPYVSDGFPADHSILLTLIWVVIIVGIFAPLGVHKYRSMSK